MPEANVNTTDIEVPKTVQMDDAPAPEPILPEAEEGELPPVFKDEVREGIHAKRRAMLEKEMTDQGLEPQAVAKIEELPVEPEAPKLDEPLPQVATSKEDEDFLLNVYGQEKKYDLKNASDREELKRLAQKGGAATQIFEEGYRMKNEALQVAQAIKQNLQPQAQPQVAQIDTQQSLDKEKVKEIAKRMNYGSEEDQAAALLDLVAISKADTKGQAQALPPEQLVNVATQNAIAYIDARTEQEILKKEFSDILADYPLSMATDVIANQLAQKYQQEGKQQTRLELFREAGNIARDKYLKPVQAPAQTAPTVQAAKVEISNDRIERKRAAPKPPAAANKIAVEPPPAYGVDVSSVVNKMRKARGQPVFN